MKNPLLPALIAIGALVGGARADAQRPENVLVVESFPAPPPAAGIQSTPASLSVTVGPVAAAPTPVIRAAVPANSAAVAAPVVQGGRLRMPTSRVLIIGGTAAALTGILVGGDTGAIVAVTGTASAIYGLYLHYR